MTRALLLAVLLLIPSCHMSLGGMGGSSNMTFHGQDLCEIDGTIYVDDVLLPFSRWEAVTLAASTGTVLEVAVPTGDVELTAAAGNAARLEVLILSEVEGEGGAALLDGRVTAVVDGAGKVLINAIRGTVPASGRLLAASSTGMVSVSGLQADLETRTGTGEIRVRDSECSHLDASSGTGDIRIEGCTVDELSVSGGTSDLTLIGIRAGTGEVDSSTGDVSIDGSSFDELSIDTGTGDMTLADCTVKGTFSVSSGTGDLSIRGGRYKLVATSFGTGDVRLANTPDIETLR